MTAPACTIDVLTGRVWYDRPPVADQRPRRAGGASSYEKRPPRTVRCTRCAEPFETRQGRACYCPTCRPIVQRETWRRWRDRRKAKAKAKERAA